jgi:hypothetical protein
MVHTRTKHHGEDEEKCNAWVEGPCDYRVESCLAHSTDGRQKGTQEVELCGLRSSKTEEPKRHHSEPDDQRMDASVRPAADCILRRILPRLKSIAMVQIVCRLPVVEHFVTVLNGCVQGRYNIGCSEDVEGDDRLELVRRLHGFHGWSWRNRHPLFRWWRGHCVESEVTISQLQVQ